MEAQTQRKIARQEAVVQWALWRTEWVLPSGSRVPSSDFLQHCRWWVWIYSNEVLLQALGARCHLIEDMTGQFLVPPSPPSETL